MTANEMTTEVELYIERIASKKGIAGYEDYEWGPILTRATWTFIKQVIDKLNNKRLGLEESEIRAQGLSALIQNATPTVSFSQTGVSTNGYFYDLPEDFYIAIREEAKISEIDCVTKDNAIVDITPKGHGEYIEQKNNPFRKPYYDGNEGEVWRLIFSRENSGYEDITTKTKKRHELITDGAFTVLEYRLRYLKNHPDIIVDLDVPTNQRNCILDDSTHPSIVSIAKDMVLEYITKQQPQITLGPDKLE